MILEHVNIIGHDGVKHLKIVRNKIQTITSKETLLKPDADELQMLFEDAIVFPGLINSHDHLEFNLFPQLANKVYNNYKEWGTDIHQQNKEIITSILKIPKQLRVEWGIYKNLINGVTTVVQHGEYFDLKSPVINVFQDSYSLHSVGLEKNWKYKLNRPFIKQKSFAIHVGEGTDNMAFEEINELLKWNILKRKLVAIHGVAMNAKQSTLFEALIWCPDSNLFLLNATAKVNELKKKTKILFGTDSTLSANWNIWEQIRLARRMNMLTDKEIFDSLTSTPSVVWELSDRGILAEGKTADIVVAKMKNNTNYIDRFFQLNPEDILLVIRDGRIILFDESLYAHLSNNTNNNSFSKLFINGTCKYVYGNLNDLIKEIRKYSPDAKFPIEVEKD